LEVAEARKQVVAALEAEGALVTIEDHVHSVGHDYRTGCVIEPYLSKQWFVKMGPLVGPAIEAVKSGRVQFVPSHHDSVYFHWMENVRDWCISRQLWWGHRIPIYECGDCGHLVCEIENAPEQCAKCGGLNMKQDPDVLDTWFSSALWPFSTLGWPDETADLKTYYPTTVLVTAHEIIFFWVARMIIMGLKFMNEVPFKQVVINPLVMDERGKKMSKSSGTAIDPLEVIEQYGTDAIRLTLASYPTQSRHISLSEKRFESWRNFNNKLWNAARFVLMNTQDLPADALAGGLGEEDLQLEDRWILHALSKTIEATTNALESFEFDKFIETIYRFTWNRYCDWYLELVKDRLYGNDRADEHVRFGAASRRAAQIVLVTVLEHTLRLLHPAAPFISEEIWQQVRDRFKMGNAGGAEGRAADTRRALEAGSIMMAPWPETARRPPSQQALMREMSDYDTMDRAVKTIGCLRTIRGEMNVPPATATDIVISTEEATHRMDLQNTEHYVRSLVSVGNIRYEIEPDASVFASTGVFEDVTIQVLLPESLRAEERARLDKEMGKLERGVQGSEAKLANPSFAGNAPETVVFKERKRLEQMQTELASLRERRAALE
jgi:valyl-tRNA synthetase